MVLLRLTAELINRVKRSWGQKGVNAIGAERKPRVRGGGDPTLVLTRQRAAGQWREGREGQAVVEAD